LSVFARALGATFKGEVREGFGSSGAMVIINGIREVFLRVPKTDEANNTPQQIWQAYQLAGVPGVIEIMALMSDGQVQHWQYPENPPFEQSQMEAMAMVLELLRYGESLTAVIDQDPPRAQMAYSALGRQLKIMHESDALVDDEELTKWRRISLFHPIEGRERFRAVVGHINYEEGWTDDDQIHRIEEKMRHLAEEMMAEKVLIYRSHGDAWRDNVMVSPDGNSVELFDNALAYAPPAYDVAFAMGDQLIKYLVTGDQEAKQRVDVFIEGYIPDSHVYCNLPLFLVYKLVVGAAFDGYNIDQRRKIMLLAEKLLDAKIGNVNQEFTIDQITYLWSVIQDET